MITEELMLESLNQLQALVKKVETTVGNVQRSLQTLERRVTRLEAHVRKPTAEEEMDDRRVPEQDAEKRMATLKVGTWVV